MQVEHLRPRHTMRQIAAKRRGDKSLRRCDKTPRLHCGCDKSLRQDTCSGHASEFWILMYADYAIVSLFLLRFLARSIALAWQPKGWIISSGLNFSHTLYDFYPKGLCFLYKTRLPFYSLLRSILKRKKLRIALVVDLVRSPFWMVFRGFMGK